MKIDMTAAFIENEKEANSYASKCTAVLALIIALMWLLNIVGLFVVDPVIMAVACGGGIVLFLLPSVLCCLVANDKWWLKLVIMGSCILGITLFSGALPKHSILAWAAPGALSSHYYSKKLNALTVAVSVLCMAASLFFGVYFGEWDANIIGAGVAVTENRVITSEIIRRLILFYILPRAMIIVGISILEISLAGRTHRLLEKQISDNMEKHRIASELSVATQIQTSMLPSIFPAFPEHREFDVYATMNPAREVGGDFYDFFMVDDTHLAIVMADVSDKGVPAALFMVIGKTLIKDHTSAGRDLGTVFTEVNNLLCESNSEGLFITAFEGVLDLVSGEFTFVNAGHEMPFISRGGSEFQAEKIRPGFVLAGMENIKYKSGSFVMQEGDKIFQYTDGVTEATNSAGELYGMTRLKNILDTAAAKSPKEILAIVKGNIDMFVDDAPQFDDITMLCLEFKKKMAVEE